VCARAHACPLWNLSQIYSFPFLPPNFLSSVLFALLILTHWATGGSWFEMFVCRWEYSDFVLKFIKRCSFCDQCRRLQLITVLFWVIIQPVVVIPYWHHHCSLHNNSEEPSSHLLHGRRLKSRKTTAVSLWWVRIRNLVSETAQCVAFLLLRIELRILCSSETHPSKS